MTASRGSRPGGEGLSPPVGEGHTGAGACPLGGAFANPEAEALVSDHDQFLFKPNTIHIRAGEPLHASAAWQLMAVGLKGMSSVLAA